VGRQIAIQIRELVSVSGVPAATMNDDQAGRRSAAFSRIEIEAEVLAPRIRKNLHFRPAHLSAR
jgi:hypothetical protein